jgi:hypothetical protein
VKNVEALFYSALLAAILYALLSYLLTVLPMRIRFARWILDRRSHFEGYYIETFVNHPERPFSVACITYNSDNKTYSYWGRAFNEDGTLGAKWRALDIDIDSGDKLIRYFFDASITSSEPRGIRGFGIIEINNGSGYFVDSGSKLQECHHNIVKITNRLLYELTGNIHMPNTENWGDLARKYVDMRG